MDYSKIITIEPGKRSGKPTIRGTRMTVTDVLEYLAGGMSEEEILADFPDLTKEDIKACLAFAADRERIREAGERDEEQPPPRVRWDHARQEIEVVVDDARVDLLEKRWIEPPARRRANQLQHLRR